MKTFKRGLSILLTAAVALSMVMAVPITASAGTGVIEINGGNDLTLHGDVSVYKIFDLTFDKDNGSYSYTPIKPTDPFADFKGYASNETESFLNYMLRLAENEELNDSDTMIDLSKALWRYITDEKIAPTATASPSGKRVTISGLEPGYYLVMGKGYDPDRMDSTDDAVMSRPILVTVDGVDATLVFLKADAPYIKKEVMDEYNGWDDWANAHIGVSVEFWLKSSVPDMTGYESYVFTVHDTMSAGLTFDPDSVSVIVGGIDQTEGVHYIVNMSPADGCTFEIIFVPTEFIKYTEGDFVSISYNATVNENAVIGSEGNSNKAQLEYSNDPNSDGKGKTPDDETAIVYIFEIPVFKYTGEDKPLAGAEFELHRLLLRGIDDEKITFELVSIGDADNPTIYRYSETGTVVTLVTPLSGLIRLIGVNMGSYSLVETKAPDGYNLLKDPIRVRITHNTGDGISILYVNDSETMPQIVKVENNSGNEFPGTGGIGRVIFIMTGSLLMAGALAALIIRKRARS